MKAVICDKPGILRLFDKPAPDVPPPGWARVAVSHVGICGTDYHIFEGKHPFLAYPRIMGHEFSGTVMDAVDGFPAGTPVVVNPYLSCGTCHACRRGKPNCCMAIRVLGVHTDGAMVEQINLPVGNLYPADGLSLEAAATVEFLAIGAHAVRRSQMVAGSTSLVIGAGPIGLGAALFSRLAGHDVTLMDKSPERLSLAARRFDLGNSILVDDGTADAVARITGGNGFDVVFDATGYGPSIEAAFAHVAHGGTLVLVSVVKDEIRFSDPEFHKREMSVIGSRNATRTDFDRVMDAIRTGGIDTGQLITHRTSLENVADRLPIWAHEKTGLIKAIIKVA